jgi:hypothetical protein
MSWPAGSLRDSRRKKSVTVQQVNSNQYVHNLLK